MALTKDALLRYFADELQVDTSKIADDETPLFSSGLVDSFAIVELLLFLEKQTGTPMSPEDITLDHLDTVRQILEFTAARTG